MRGDVVVVAAAGELEVVEEEVVDAAKLSYEGKGWSVGGPSFKVYSSFVVVVTAADNGDVVVVVDIFGCMVVLVAIGISSSYIGLRFYVIIELG